MPLPLPVGSLGCVGTQSSHHRASPSPGPWSIAAAAHVQDVDGLGRSNCPHPHTLALCRPVPDLERFQVACLHSPRVWAIPQRAKEKARILAWWLSSTSSFRRSSLPRWNFYAFEERRELRGPHLALSSPHPRASILQGSQSPKHSILNPHFLVRQDQSPVTERKCPVSHRHTVPCREIFPSAAQPPPHSASTSADQVGNPISNLAKHLDPSPAWR